MENLELWNSTMDETYKLSFVLFLQCTDETLKQRVLKRSETSGRADDNPVTFEKRLKTYKEDTMPVIEYYKAKNIVKEVDSNRTKEEVFADVEKIFEGQ